MKYYLYEFEDNWADEMDLAGFAILTEVEKDIALAKIRKEYKKGGSIGFGSNQDNEYDTLSDVMNTISFKKITEAEYNVIKKTLGVTFGETGPLDTSDLDDDYDDYDDREFDDDEDEDDGEEEYNSHAMKITNFIEKEYGIEPESYSPDSCFSNYNWKPTPNTTLTILVGAYSEDDEEEVEINLIYKSKTVSYEFFKVEDIWSNPEGYLVPVMRSLIEKAKKY